MAGVGAEQTPVGAREREPESVSASRGEPDGDAGVVGRSQNRSRSLQVLEEVRAAPEITSREEIREDRLGRHASDAVLIFEIALFALNPSHDREAGGG